MSQCDAMPRSIKIYRVLLVAMSAIIFIALLRRSINLFLIVQDEKILMDFLRLYPFEYLFLYISNLFLQIGSLTILTLYKKARGSYLIPIILVITNIVENSVLAVETVTLLTYSYVIFNGIYISILSASAAVMYIFNGGRI